MTLARKRSDGSFDIGGVYCPACDCDRYINSKSGKCTWCGAGSKYKPRGTVIKVLNPNIFDREGHLKMTEKVIAKCSECKKKKELTMHGTCWPCHLGKVNIKTHIEVRKVKEGEGKERMQDFKIIGA